MDTLANLELALLLTRPGMTRALARRLLKDGPAALRDEFEQLPSEQADRLRLEAADLAARGIDAVLHGANEYPHLLNQLKDAPPVLFFHGERQLFDKQGVGVCGSRNVSEHGLRAATICGEVASSLDIVSVSGYARGVDTATHISSLQSGGSTIIVLPEGINHFRVKRGQMTDAWDASRTLVVSQFAPGQTWSAGGAMSRNNVIIGLGMALVVVEAGEKGGTLAAGEKALSIGRRVMALEFPSMPSGNQMLIDRGAISVSGRPELTVFMDELRSVVEPPSIKSKMWDTESFQQVLDLDSR